MSNTDNQNSNRVAEQSAERSGNQTENQTDQSSHETNQNQENQSSQEVLTKTDVQAMISETVLKFKNEILELFHTKNEQKDEQPKEEKKRSL